MKKLLLSLGAVAAVVAPVAAVVACGADKAPTTPAKTNHSHAHQVGPATVDGKGGDAAVTGAAAATTTPIVPTTPKAPVVAKDATITKTVSSTMTIDALTLASSGAFNGLDAEELDSDFGIDLQATGTMADVELNGNVLTFSADGTKYIITITPAVATPAATKSGVDTRTLTSIKTQDDFLAMSSGIVDLSGHDASEIDSTFGITSNASGEITDFIFDNSMLVLTFTANGDKYEITIQPADAASTGAVNAEFEALKDSFKAGISKTLSSFQKEQLVTFLGGVSQVDLQSKVDAHDFSFPGENAIDPAITPAGFTVPTDDKVEAMDEQHATKLFMDGLKDYNKNLAPTDKLLSGADFDNAEATIGNKIATDPSYLETIKHWIENKEFDKSGADFG